MFEFEAHSGPGPGSWSISEAVKIFADVLGVVASDEELYVTALRNDSLFAFVVKLWYLSTDTSVEKHLFDRTVSLFDGIFAATAGGVSHWDLTEIALCVIAKQTGGNMDKFAKLIMGYLNTPIVPTLENLLRVARVLTIVIFLTHKDVATPTEVIDIFLKYDLVERVCQHLLYASSTPYQLSDPSHKLAYIAIINPSTRILFAVALSRTSPRSVMHMLKHGFLHSIANLLSSSTLFQISGNNEENVKKYIIRRIFCSPHTSTGCPPCDKST